MDCTRIPLASMVHKMHPTLSNYVKGNDQSF
jgi:hypothetical protein